MRIITSALLLAACGAKTPPEAKVTNAAVEQADAEPGVGAEVEGLRLSLAGASRADGGFRVKLILENTGERPIYVYERWNSWGAGQWSLEIVNANGAPALAANPQQDWTRNFPSAFVLAPGASLMMPCAVAWTEGFTWTKEDNRFVLEADAPPVPPLRVRGLFESHADRSPPEAKIGVRDQGGLTISSADLWRGALATAWVDLP